MSGPYDQPIHNQAPGFYPGPVPGQAPGFFPGAVHGAPINQPTSAYVTTEVTHGEHVKQSGSTSSSGSYVADHHGGHIGYGGGPVHNVSHHGGYGGGPVHNVSYHGGYGGGSFESGFSGPRRHGRYRRQVIRLPEAIPGCVRQVRHRLLTPEPDVLDRVYIQRQGGDIIEEITEVPTTPPPRVQERTVVEPSGPPQVVRKVIRVPPRSGGYSSYHGDIGFSHAAPVVSTGSYANLLPATGSIQHFGGIPCTDNFGGLPLGGYTGGLTNFGGFGAALPQPSFNYGAALPQPSFNYGAALPQPSFNYGAALPQPSFNYGAALPQANFGFGAALPQTSFGFGAALPQPSFGFGGFQSQALLPAAPALPANCFII
ncbi:unnamed protein product [Rotaria sordida]|uniref:Uncharacterized protein n=1 Tax=Rotaria sordida TaxID=392033 RepID=A0A818SVA9_9BILA|nr:unnamed protein product [Rotaria sordida]CAF3677954.1 unnamed protein product [Rotaria sordida]